jgi:hypothetical protein
MFSFLTAIPSMLGGLFSTVNNITSAISNERIALINATTDREKIEIQERISALQAQQSVLIADASKSNIDMYVRTGFALGPMLYLLKIFIWDKVLNIWTNGSTDPLDNNLWSIVVTVVGFYFVASAAEGITRIIKS